MSNQFGFPDPNAGPPPNASFRAPAPDSSDADIDAYFTSLFGDDFPELEDLNERRQLAGVSRALSRSLALGLGDEAPRPSLQNTVLAAVRNEAAKAATTATASATASATAASTNPPAAARPEHHSIVAAPETSSPAPTKGRGVDAMLPGLFKRFRGRIAIVLIALVAAITALFSSFGSSPVVAASAVLAPNPGSPTPQASGTADFISPKKGAQINKVAMKVEGLTPTTAETEYQCWLVGPGDAPESPNRKLVGTFSTTDGTADFGWKAEDYSPDFAQLDISLEQKDGNPEYGGVTVLSTKKYNGKRTG